MQAVYDSWKQASSRMYRRSQKKGTIETLVDGSSLILAREALNRIAAVEASMKIPEEILYSKDLNSAFSAMRITSESAVIAVKGRDDFKVGAIVYTIVDEDMGYDPCFIAKSMIIKKSNSAFVDSIDYYGYKKPQYLLSNGHKYVGAWLAEVTSKPAPDSNKLAPQANVDEEYDPEKVMKAIRDSCGG